MTGPYRVYRHGVLSEAEERIADELARDGDALAAWARQAHCDPRVNAGAVYIEAMRRRARVKLPRAIVRRR